MEEQKGLSAVDERRRKLNEYLAAKGKLKPQTNTKPYLKDCTNHQRPPCRSKLPLVRKIEEKNVTNAKAVSQENKPKTSSHFSVQQRSSSAKPTVRKRATASVAAKPRNPLVPSGINTNPLQEKKRATKAANVKVVGQSHIQTGLGTGEKEVASCAQNFTSEIDIDAAANRRGELASETKKQDNRTDYEKLKDCLFHKGKLAGEDWKAIQQLPKTIDNTEVGLTASNKERWGTQVASSVSLKVQATHSAVIHKINPRASVTQRPSGKSLYCTNRTHLDSKSGQPGSQCRNVSVQQGRSRSSRSLSSRPNVSQNGNNILKQKQDIKIQTVATASQKPTHGGLKKTKRPYEASSEVAAEQQPKHKKEHVSSTAFSGDQMIIYQKTCNKEPPQHKNTDIATSINPHLKPKNGAMTDTCTQMKDTECKKLVEKTWELTTVRSLNEQLDVNSNEVKLHATPHVAAEDRKKKLEEWLSSKGKTYKRPPMIVPTKKPMKRKTTATCSLWDGIEEEEDLMYLSKKINGTLNECLELIDKGAASEAVYAILFMVPEAEKFAKFWVCKAKLLEREGTFDVVGLYEQAVRSGAKPIAELREVIFDVMRNTSKKRKDEPLQSQNPASCYPSSPASQAWNAVKSLRTPCTELCKSRQGSAVKFQVATLPSKNRSGAEWKTLTPVRRSLRINPATSRRSDVLQDPNKVVTSLEELLEMADTDCFLYAGNEAFPKETHSSILDMIKQRTSNKPD
ncbi:hypothetical protein XELAEV_18020281mg [Xenopus laevis]|nr:hypothetical protein XELAEV_18020281mg [Xenopus laevis]